MAKIDYPQLAKDILENVGGASNVEEADVCSTRIRFELIDPSLVDEKALKAAGAVGVMKMKDSVQVIVGTHVQGVFSEMEDLL